MATTPKGEVESIKSHFPKVDVSRLEAIVENSPYKDDSGEEGYKQEYIINRMFTNGLVLIPNKFPDIQKAYFELALYYYKKGNITTKSDDPILNVTSSVSHIFNLLLDPNGLPNELGNSKVYEQVAREVMQFYQENRDNIQLLAEIGNILYGIYFCLGEPQTRWDPFEVKGGYDISILKGMVRERGEDVLKEPSIIRTVWEKVREAYKR